MKKKKNENEISLDDTNILMNIFHLHFFACIISVKVSLIKVVEIIWCLQCLYN